MNKRINIFVAYYMAFMILMGTTGFSVYRHHCSTQNSTQISLFIDLTGCDHEDEHHSDATSCCSHEHEEATGCCDATSDHATCSSSVTDEESNCCNTEKKHFRLIAKYDLPNLVVEKVQFIPILLAVFELTTEDKSSVEYFKYSFGESGPPLRYGVDLLRAIQQLKFHI